MADWRELMPGARSGDTNRTKGWFRVFAYAAQFFFGGWFFYNGLNYFVGFTPPPPGSSPATRELMAGLEQTGLFAVVKGIELVTGAALLANRFVPLATLLAFPVTFAIAWVMIVINGGGIGYIVGTLALALNAAIALSRWEHFALLIVIADRGAQSPLAIARQPGVTELEPYRLKPAVHAACALLGVGLSAGIELGTMAYFQSVARSSMSHTEQGAAFIAPGEDG